MNIILLISLARVKNIRDITGDDHGSSDINELLPAPNKQQ